MQSAVNIGICGLGTVGGSLLRALPGGAAGANVRVVHLAGRSGLPAQPPPGCRCSTDPMAVADDPQVHILVELLGGIDLPQRLALRAMDQGKHLITANKALMASHGRQLLALAAQRNLRLGMEGAVAGAIPVLRSLHQSFAGNPVERIQAVLNGTCNYILEQMEDGLDYGQALARAQKLGYAEADPALDVGGQDAAYKLAILAALAFLEPLPEHLPKAEGIESVQPQDLRLAADMGYSIRHLALAARSASDLDLSAQPALVPRSSPLARLSGPGNGIMVHGCRSGPLYFQGAGAGGEATASAVLADLVEIACGRAAPWPAQIWSKPANADIDSPSDAMSFYVRADKATIQQLQVKVRKRAQLQHMHACITEPMPPEDLQRQLPTGGVYYRLEDCA